MSAGVAFRAMRHPLPVGLHEKLEASDLGRCRHCRCWLYYQQREERPTYPRHFFFCASCGRRYAAWEMGWTPGAAERDG